MDRIPSIDVGKAANAARLELMACCMAAYPQTMCDAAQHAIQAAIDAEHLRDAVSGPGNPFDNTD
jgi:hypothetical protein